MSKAKPRVSVGLPIYNAAEYLAFALDGLLSQAFDDVEVIVSDNGSTDASAEIGRAYAARDARIHFHQGRENRGGIWNFNRVFELSRGEYFMWHAHDDVLAPEFLARCVAILDQFPDVVLCHTNTLVTDAQGQILSRYREDLHLMADNPYERYKQWHVHDRECPLCSVFYGLTRSAALRRTPVRLPFVYSESNLISELALLGKIYQIPDHLFYRRDHPQASTRQYRSNKDLMAWIDPTRLSHGLGPEWQMFSERLKSIGRVPISRQDKLRCALFTLQFFALIPFGSHRRKKSYLGPAQEAGPLLQGGVSSRSD
jgi:glycosyltransferase involved in cell wall biosynthesis